MEHALEVNPANSQELDMPFPQTIDYLKQAGYTFIEHSKCNGPTCTAIIEWWRTPRGKKMPFDVSANGAVVPHWSKGNNILAESNDLGGCWPLEALVCGYSGEHRVQKVVWMLQGFADESEGRVVSITGCVLPFLQWQAFSKDWFETLAEPPAIKYFHMREARGLTGQFQGFRAKDRDLKIIRLVSVALKFKPDILTSWVSVDDYQSIVGPVTPFEAKNCYFPCFFVLLFKAAAHSRDRGYKLPIDFVFDEKGKIGTYAVNWYEHVKVGADATLKPYFGATPIFRSDVQMLPLQLADLLGWHLHRKLEIPGNDIERIATERLDELPHSSSQLDRAFLAQIAAEFRDVFEKEPLAILMQEKPSKRRKIISRLKRELRDRMHNP